MTSSIFVEDAFVKFYLLVDSSVISAEHRDLLPIESFYDVITAGKQLTKSQSNFILRILSKYKNDIESRIPDIEQIINNPRWKGSFREIDRSKKISLSEDSNRIVYIDAKFPYAFKDTFFKDFIAGARNISQWDNETKCQKIKLLDINLVHFYEQAKKYNFEIDHEIIDLVEGIEEIWNDQDSYIPYSEIVDGSVVLRNATESAAEYFEKEKTGDTDRDSFMAKTLGHPVKNLEPVRFLDKIISSEENKFWIKDNLSFIHLVKQIKDWPIVVILDRTADAEKWCRNFINDCSEQSFEYKIKICFRHSNETPDGLNFNQWIKTNGLGADMTEGQIFVCHHKPPKWMFKEDFKIKMIVSNVLYPSTNSVSSNLLDNHPMVFFLGDIRPSEKRNKKIVEL